MPRRTHTKSRSGCVKCKRRHVKCDEQRPQCVNCRTAGVICEYAGNAQAKTNVTVAGSVRNTVVATNASTPTARLQDEQPSGTSMWTLPAPGPVADVGHLELLHHFCTITYDTRSPESAQQRTWQYDAVKIGLSYSFLLHEILAIAALHLAYCRPEKKMDYSTKATELQSIALNEFNVVQNKVDSASCGAILLFASLLALHILADETQTAGLDSTNYLDHLLSYIELVSGVRKLAIFDWERDIRESELKPLLEIEEPKPPYSIPEECRQLSSLMENCDLGPASISAYKAAIERLHWVFALSEVPSKSHSTIRWLVAWPIQLKDDYLSLLKARRPEALIILAYYGVVLHSYRESWIIRDSGVVLIRTINAYVGRYWERWLAWPNQIIASTATTLE